MATSQDSPAWQKAHHLAPHLAQLLQQDVDDVTRQLGSGGMRRRAEETFSAEGHPAATNGRAAALAEE